MAKKLFGLSVFLWILLAFVVLFFVFGVGRREGYEEEKGCTSGRTGSVTLGGACNSVTDCCTANSCILKKRGPNAGKTVCSN